MTSGLPFRLVYGATVAVVVLALVPMWTSAFEDGFDPLGPILSFVVSIPLWPPFGRLYRRRAFYPLSHREHPVMAVVLAALGVAAVVVTARFAFFSGTANEAFFGTVLFGVPMAWLAVLIHEISFGAAAQKPDKGGSSSQPA